MLVVRKESVNTNNSNKIKTHFGFGVECGVQIIFTSITCTEL